MTSTSERRAWRVLAAVLAGALALAGPAAADDDPARVLLREAHVALGRGDGIAAEVALRKALNAGVPRDQVAARMGEAFLDQGDLRKAREWLGPAQFTLAEAPHGWRMLGRLEMAAGNLPAAGRAFDQVLKLTPQDSKLWVDISRLRYRGGEQLQAIAAADQAVRLDRGNVRALEWRGLLVRDSYGLQAALPWFEAGLAVRADDLSLLGEYAATLGELGRARDMLVVTRRMIGLDPRNARAFYLQAVLAARAGNVALARHLLERAGPRVLDMPAALLLAGTLELEAGNAHLAVELLDRLVRLQPDNGPAQQLLARAMAGTDDIDGLVARFGGQGEALARDPYLATVLARAQERRGDRAEAGRLLDLAARPVALPLVIADSGAAATTAAMADLLRVRLLAQANDKAAAAALAQRVLTAVPGAAAAHVLAGDLRFLADDMAGALEQYRLAAAVRMTDPLVLRITACLVRSGKGAMARQFVAQVRTGWPRSPLALRLQAGFAGEDGNWPLAAATLQHLAAIGLNGDPRIEAALAESLLHSSKPAAALAPAATAYGLQPLGDYPARTYAAALRADRASGGSADLVLARIQAWRPMPIAAAN